MRTDKAAAAVGALTILAFLLLAEPPANASPPPPKKPDPTPPPPKKPDPTPPPPNPPQDGDDVIALARMLRSETSQRSVWPVIGWMALTTARRRGLSVYERLTAGKGYGRRVKDGVARYASTAQSPSEQSLTAARAILRGDLVPSAKIRAFGHSSWVEILTQREEEAEALLRKQEGSAKWGGVFARIRGTNWYLLNPAAPPIKWERGAARAALAQVPVYDPTDGAAYA